jgi:hypothetical protein
MNVTNRNGANGLCDTLQNLARRVWSDLEDSTAIGLTLGEASITDYLLLELTRAHPHEVWVEKFTSRAEGKTTGADWEWWFGSRRGWIGMRVQAKRLDTSRRDYPELKNCVRPGRALQSTLLMSDARRQGLVPLYCFYNFWQGKPEPLAPWCKASGRALWGCTIAGASPVRKRVQTGSIDLATLLPLQRPLCCLACSGQNSWQGRELVESVGLILDDILPPRGRRPSASRSERATPPRYVDQIMDRPRATDERSGTRQLAARPREELGFEGESDGVLVVRVGE